MSEVSTKRDSDIELGAMARSAELLSGPNGSGKMVLTKDLDIAKLVTSEQRLEEEKFLEGKETQIENRYRGMRRYLRLFEITRVIALLSLYLTSTSSTFTKNSSVATGKNALGAPFGSRGSPFTAKNSTQ